MPLSFSTAGQHLTTAIAKAGQPSEVPWAELPARPARDTPLCVRNVSPTLAVANKMCDEATLPKLFNCRSHLPLPTASLYNPGPCYLLHPSYPLELPYFSSCHHGFVGGSSAAVISGVGMPARHAGVGRGGM